MTGRAAGCGGAAGHHRWTAADAAGGGPADRSRVGSCGRSPDGGPLAL